MNLEKIKFPGTRIPCKVLQFMELEFHLNVFKELEFQNFFFFNFHFAITRLSKN